MSVMLTSMVPTGPGASAEYSVPCWPNMHVRGIGIVGVVVGFIGLVIPDEPTG